MTAKTRKPLKHKKLIIVLSIILAVVIVITAAAAIFINVGEYRLRKKLTYGDENMSAEDAYGDNAEVFYEGQGYKYNENLINILCIGVDKYGSTNKHDRQSDALYLLSLDTKSHKFNVIAISRNTLADIDIYDINNELLGTDNAQICLSYAFGKDEDHSSLLTCKSVSHLMYDIPINAYYTVFMGAVGEIVDAVGGVELVLQDDMTYDDASWKKGSKIKLNKNNALTFLRSREESHIPRFEHQKQFIESFMTSAKTAFKKDVSMPLKVANKISKNSVTNIDFSQITYLATQISDASFSLTSLEGTDGFDGTYETFTVDDEALYKTVLNLFYIKTN